jgi:phosphatidylserine/phosphatidylglycerophosphate/cardiolipin synthase-like enzyme
MARPTETWLPIAIVLIIGLTMILVFSRFHEPLHLGQWTGNAQSPGKPPHPQPSSEDLKSAGIISEEHFSPGEDLEHLDLYRLGQARLTLDVAMYSFTDKQLADQIVSLAKQGVVVRIYRDREQYNIEQRSAAQRHEQSTTDLFKDVPNIQVRVKGRRELMRIKAYLIDGAMLRDGSADWTQAGEKWQDNNARFTNNQGETRFFIDAFDEMWARPDNQVVQ